MKLLTFLARRFWWKTFSKTLESAPDQEVEREVTDAVVVYLHVEARDQGDDRRPGVLKKTLKHIKWLAGKRSLRRVVLHSFTHLGGENAEPDFALALMEEIKQRLEGSGYRVWITPFGYFNEWDLNVYGESLAKVWKEI